MALAVPLRAAGYWGFTLTGAIPTEGLFRPSFIPFLLRLFVILVRNWQVFMAGRELRGMPFRIGSSFPEELPAEKPQPLL